MATTYQIGLLETLADSVNAICGMVGHPKSNDPAGSDDPAVQQMTVALNLANQQLMPMQQWQALLKEMEIEIQLPDGVTGTKEWEFDLPPDFFGWVDQTQWNQTTMLPAMGPISPQAWMTYVVRTTFPQLSIYWQVRGKKLWTLNPPVFGKPYRFRAMYISQGVVLDEASTDDAPILKSEARKNGDSWVLDGTLVTLLGRAKYLAFKGFATDAAISDFQTAFETRVAKPEGGPVLNMSRSFGYPYLGYGNMPDTGFGSAP